MLECSKFDFIIIGAGPAGLTAAQYSSRASLNTLLIDESEPGGQALNIFYLENYPGLFPSVTGAQFINNAKNQALNFGAKIIQTKVKSVDKIKNEFVVETSNGTYIASVVLLATGAEHRKLGIPGEKEFMGRGVSYCATCDGPFFKNKKIIVIGGGDSACDEASYLATLTNSVTIIHRKNQFRAQNAVAQRVLSNPKINVLFNSKVLQINGDSKVTSIIVESNGNQIELKVDGVFIFVGMIPRTSLFEMLPSDVSGYIKTDENMKTMIPGLYAAGDVRSKSFRQIVTACADGAIAANEACRYIRELNNEVYN